MEDRVGGTLGRDRHAGREAVDAAELHLALAEAKEGLWDGVIKQCLLT